MDLSGICNETTTFSISSNHAFSEANITIPNTTNVATQVASDEFLLIDKQDSQTQVE